MKIYVTAHYATSDWPNPVQRVGFTQGFFNAPALPLSRAEVDEIRDHFRTAIVTDLHRPVDVTVLNWSELRD